MGKPKAPTPPDPATTAAAQTGTNISTAQANAILGNVNQVTPQGTLTYDQSGSKFVSDANGANYWQGPNGQYQTNAPTGASGGTTTKVPIYGPASGGNNRGSGGSAPKITGYRDVTTGGGTPAGWSQVKGYYVPQYTATQKLSPEQQAIFDQTQGAQLHLGELANQQSSFLKDYMAKPVDLSNDAVEKRLFELGRKRLDPMFDAQRQSMEQDLANKGIGLGSKAYDTSNRQQYEGQNDAYNQLLLSGHQQGVSDILAERNQPINEITALLSGSQLTQPQYANANMPSIPTVDYAGLKQDEFSNKMGIYQQKQAQSQGLLGGLFGLGGKLIGLSMRSTKTDIQRVGKDPKSGLPLYAYRYKGDPKTYPKMVGVMADEVEKVNPGAVITIGDTKLVDYGKALLGEAA